jgi:hypothetical protein
MEEYIKNLEQNKKKSGSPARSGTVGWPTVPDLAGKNKKEAL